MKIRSYCPAFTEECSLYMIKKRATKSNIWCQRRISVTTVARRSSFSVQAIFESILLLTVHKQRWWLSSNGKGSICLVSDAKLLKILRGLPPGHVQFGGARVARYLWLNLRKSLKIKACGVQQNVLFRAAPTAVDFRTFRFKQGFYQKSWTLFYLLGIKMLFFSVA